jgi:hypothetical protein
VKRILQTNQRMKDELQLHMEETASLQRENNALASENKKLAREVELRAQREAEFAKRGTKQARDVKETTTKVRSETEVWGPKVKRRRIRDGFGKAFHERSKRGGPSRRGT